MKKLLLLGGFPQMSEIVQKARSMGIYTIVVDRDSASPAKQYADKAVDLSTDRIDELEALCRAEGVDGVFNGFEDFNIHIACELCQRLGLPFYSSRELIAMVTNKLAFKDACREYGVPVIEQYTLEAALEEGRYPYIVKPADSYGSRGISICRNREELCDGYERAKATSRTHSAILERFINTDHGVELFYTIVDGRIHLTVTADRYTLQSGDTAVPLPVAEVFPSRHRDDLVRKLDGNVRRMLAGMGVRNGLVLVQALWDERDGVDEYFVYEMAHRFTGEQHYCLVEKQHGVHLGEMMIRYALGEDISSFDTSLLDDSAFVRPAINLAVLLQPGTIREISGTEGIPEMQEVLSCNLVHKPGDVISGHVDYSHMLLRINMVADDYATLRHAVEQATAHISVRSVDGQEMVMARFQLPEVR